VNDVLTLLCFWKLYLQYKPDIIHLHSSKAGILGRLAFPKSKIVYTVHGFDSIRLAYRKFLPLERFLQRRCKAIVGVSHYDENNLKDEHITHNIVCVYNGI
jgi:glycogen synthase